MIKSKDPSLYVLEIDSKKQYFEYHCVRCGKCCHIWEIEIQKEDIDNWESDNRLNLLKNIQIYPQSISVMNLGLIQRLAEMDLKKMDLSNINYIRSIIGKDQVNIGPLIQELMTKQELQITGETIEEIQKILEFQGQIIGFYITGEVKDIAHNITKNVDELKNFILKNHDYQGEPSVDRWGNPIQDPLMNELKIRMPEYFHEQHGLFKGKVPHWLLGIQYGPRGIFSPNSFQAIKEGWRRGLSYYLIYELAGGCGFLKNNLCSIHEYKPIACKLFPSNRRALDPTADIHFLESCKGLKRLLG